jgi:D-glycero-D-manno-heptose 1,7-bisphosphate phosphatase
LIDSGHPAACPRDPENLYSPAMSFIILDRDGVINYDSDEYIKSPDEWLAIPGSLAAIAQLNRHGFRVLIATNQSGVGRGFYDIETLDRIHEKLTYELAAVGGYIEHIFFCPHHPDEHCVCRKPKPGMLFQIQEKYPIELSDTFFIGDSHVDVEAARAAGCKPILILSKKGKLALEKNPAYTSLPQFPHLAAAVEYVLSQPRKPSC